VDPKRIIHFVLQRRSHFEDGIVPVPSAGTWNLIRDDLANEMTAYALYAFVKQNRYNIQDLLFTKHKEIVPPQADVERVPHEPDVESSDECSDEEFTIPDVQKEFTVDLSHDQWETIEPVEKGRIRKCWILKEGWTDLVSEEVWKVSKLCCAWVFKRGNVHPTSPTAYVKMSAACPECDLFLIAQIESLPAQPGNPVQLVCTIFGEPRLSQE